jgi:hypothetical protein
MEPTSAIQVVVVGRVEDYGVQEDRSDSLGCGVRDTGYCYRTRRADYSRSRSHDHT